MRGVALRCHRDGVPMRSGDIAIRLDVLTMRGGALRRRGVDQAMRHMDQGKRHSVSLKRHRDQSKPSNSIVGAVYRCFLYLAFRGIPRCRCPLEKGALHYRVKALHYLVGA